MTKQSFRVGLIGNHIGSSLSPALHTAEARAQSITDFSYEIFDLSEDPRAPERLDEVLSNLLKQGFTGFNVTHPYKQLIASHLDILDESAQRLGSVNTIVREKRKWVGYNTDQQGFLASLQNGLPVTAKRDSVVLFGAGGAGIAVASALIEFGVRTLCVIDTDPVALTSVQKQLEATLPDGTSIKTGGPEMSPQWVPDAAAVVNATPVGMEHLPGAPFNTKLVENLCWVADLIYRPVETELLAAARRHGCTTINGTRMLVEQAADAFELLTQHAPSRHRMRNHLSKLLTQ